MPEGTMLTMIPLTPAEITPRWLTAALRSAGAIGHTSVVRVEQEIVGEDRGFTGAIARLRLAYDRPEPGAPASLIAKMPLAERTVASSLREAQRLDPARRAPERERSLREARFYRAIGTLPATLPRVYAVADDIEAGRLVILLEDLSAGRPGDALRSCTVAEARAVVAAIARLHARFWESPALRAIDWLPAWATDPATMAERYRRNVEPVLERYGARVPVYSRRLMLALPAHNERVLATLNGPPATLIHADLHLDNVIFRGEDDASEAVILDWQTVSRGLGALDLNSFVTGSLSIDDRRVAEPGLMDLYLATLDAGGIRDYGIDDLRHHYRLALLWQLGGTVGWLARTIGTAPEGRELALVDAIFDPGRFFAALEDHDVGLLLR